MIINVTNALMSHYSDVCEKFIDKKGVLGYACAYNGRKLASECLEYLKTRDRLLQQYGTRDVDENGEETGRVSITPSNENWEKVVNELSAIEDISHDVEIMQVKPDDVMDQLTGREIVELGWMIEGWE